MTTELPVVIAEFVDAVNAFDTDRIAAEIGRASCRVRV